MYLVLFGNLNVTISILINTYVDEDFVTVSIKNLHPIQ